jgi:hypothetical protein
MRRLIKIEGNALVIEPLRLGGGRFHEQVVVWMLVGACFTGALAGDIAGTPFKLKTAPRRQIWAQLGQMAVKYRTFGNLINPAPTALQDPRTSRFAGKLLQCLAL